MMMMMMMVVVVVIHEWVRWDLELVAQLHSACGRKLDLEQIRTQTLRLLPHYSL